MFKAKKYKLSNGLKVVLVHMPSSPTTTVEVRVETGSKYENDQERGLSHFLEHMCFKGTKKLPSAQAVHNALDALGAVSNAFTSTEATGYWAKASAKNVLPIIDIVSDIYQNAIFKDEDVKKESGVIIEEINMYEDQPQAIAGELFDREMHGNQPAGLPVIGTKQSVSSFKAEDFYNYRAKHYVAEATTVVVSGSFDEKRVLNKIKESFKDAPTRRKAGKPRTTIKHRGARVVHRHKETDQAHLVLGFRSYPYTDKRNTVVSVIRGILSSGMSSRLFHKLREELGICYYVYATNSSSTDHGEFAVVSGVDPKRIDVAVKAIVEELQRLKSELVPNDELERVKHSMISKMYMALETSDNVLEYFSTRATFYGDLKTPQEREREIKSVTAKQIQEEAKRLFNNKDRLLVVVSREANVPKLKKALASK